MSLTIAVSAMATDLRYLLALNLMESALKEHDLLLPQLNHLDWKENHTEVTLIDRKIESMWRQKISELFPQDGICGEEEGIKISQNQFTWYLDPIDGTRSLARGVPLYGPMVALESQGVILWSFIVYPGLKKALTAIRGHGVWIKESLKGPWERGKLSTCKNPEQAMILSSGPEYFKNVGAMELWDNMSHFGLGLRTWGDCFGYYLFATGRAEIVIDALLKPWDIAPVRIIGEELNAQIYDLNWEKVTKDKGLALSCFPIDELIGKK